MTHQSPRTKQGKRQLVETVVDEAVAAEAVADVEAVAEGAVVAGDVDEASRVEPGIGG